MSATFESLLQTLASKGVRLNRERTINAEKQPTSLRLKPETKHFFECQAEALNTSVQSVIHMALDGVAEATMNRPSAALRTTRERFFFLFESHGLSLPDVVSVMKGFGFSLSALDDPGRLLDLLDQNALDHIAATFFVTKQWLNASSAVVTPEGVATRWYKNIHSVGHKLLEYRKAGLDPRVLFVRRQNADFQRAYDREDEGIREPVGFVTELRRRTADGISFKVFESHEVERWNYAPCRHQIKALICFCEQMDIPTVGYELPEPEIGALGSHERLPVLLMERHSLTFWYPEDYGSLKFEVSLEAEDMPFVKEEYERSLAAKGHQSKSS